MEEQNKQISVISTGIGTTVDIYLQSPVSSSGFIWCLSQMPDGLILIDSQRNPVLPEPADSPYRQIFTFSTVREGKFNVSFSLIQVWDPSRPADQTQVQINASADDADPPENLNTHLGRNRFAAVEAHMRYAKPALPYGFPSNDGLSSGRPPIMVPLYGIVVDDGTSAMATESMTSVVVEDPSRCIALYGTPRGIALTAELCTQKYGFPIGVKGDLETIIARKGPNNTVIHDPKNCVMMYGTPTGLSLDPAKCVNKYGFPIIREG
ncbi:MAG: protease inhibitor I42 family protein [Candidatus Omnitrophota bacterium]